MIRKSLLVTLCLFYQLQRERLPPVARPNCPPLLTHFWLERNTKDIETGKKNGRTGEGAILKWVRWSDRREIRKVAEWSGDEEEERGIVTGFRMRK